MPDSAAVALADLQPGERVVQQRSIVQLRTKRFEVRVRVVGEQSVAWAEASILWGATVDAWIVNDMDNDRLCGLLSLPRPISPKVAASLRRGPSGFEGVVMATLLSAEDAALLTKLVTLWRPAVVVVAGNLGGGRAARNTFCSTLNKVFGETHDFFRYYQLCHARVGGVTAAVCQVHAWTRKDAGVRRESLMMAEEYSRSIQTALDDTVGADIEGNQLDEPLLGEVLPEHAVGFVTGRNDDRRPVFDGKGRAPDLSALAQDDRRILVLASSTFSKTRVIRRIKHHELLGMWDYEGKLEAQGWTRPQRDEIIRRRLQSPPAKIVRSFVFKLCDLFAPTDLDERVDRAVGLTTDVPFSPLEQAVSTRLTAAKADNAEVDLSLWALPEESEEETRARAVLRRFALRCWVRMQERSACAWLAARDPVKWDDHEAVEDCLRRCRAATYWSWPRGSRLLFWKFPDEWAIDARDGVPFCHTEDPPAGFLQNTRAPSREAELEMRRKVFFKLVFRGYVEPGRVTLVTPRFPVIKVKGADGEQLDIRVVWDCKKNGLNATLFAHGFMLPSFQDAEDQVVRWLDRPVGEYLDAGSPTLDYALVAILFIISYQFDIDVGEMFHNFRAHKSGRHLLGLRVPTTRSDPALEEERIMRFNVCCFGLKCSPDHAGQGQARVLECCKGDRHEPRNPYQWSTARLNLPCSTDYDPSFPRVMLLRDDNELATRIVTYVDDIRGAGRGQDQARQAARALSANMNSMGNQADPRKIGPASTQSGAWKGVLLHTDTPFPVKSTTTSKWNRFRDGCLYILGAVQTGTVETAELRRIAGLGVHLSEVYPETRCYLKGFFNAMEAFREGRDLNGWRLERAMLEARAIELEDVPQSQAREGYPLLTRITDELIEHAKALLRLYPTETPASLPIRPTDKHKLRYVIGDASAEGFGTGTQYPDRRVVGRDGLWVEAFAQGGSNLREAQNQVNHLLVEIRAGRHDGCELWVFTDNAVWSAVWYKGMSSAKHLFELVLLLKLECRAHEVYAHLCHISGDRMIATGMDGWSRGNQDGGISVGHDLRTLVPLNLGAFELKGDGLERWCRSWMGGDYRPPLAPEGWFSTGHQPGVHVWAPPPAAALVALKELAQSRQKRRERVTHVFICQRILWQEEWRTRFEKEVDVWFFLHPGSVWTHDMFEPLLVGISFPSRRRAPWLVRRERDKMVETGRALSQMSRACHVRVGDHLRQLWGAPWSFQGL